MVEFFVVKGISYGLDAKELWYEQQILSMPNSKSKGCTKGDVLPPSPQVKNIGSLHYKTRSLAYNSCT